MTFTNTDTSNCESNFRTLWIPSRFTSRTFTLLIFTVSLSHVEKLPSLPHTYHRLPSTLPSLRYQLFYFFFFFLFCFLLWIFLVSWVGAGCVGTWERGLWAHSWCLMNEGCLWLLGEESSFNMSLERGPGWLYWSRRGRYVRDGVWQEETVGHRKEWWPWKTQIHRPPLGNTKLSTPCAFECCAHIADAGISNEWQHLWGCMCINTVVFVLYMFTHI